MRWLRRRKEWFSIITPAGEEVSGVRNSQGLDITVKSGWDTIHVQVPMHQVDKLRDWLMATYPVRGERGLSSVIDIRDRK